MHIAQHVVNLEKEPGAAVSGSTSGNAAPLIPHRINLQSPDPSFSLQASQDGELTACSFHLGRFSGSGSFILH